MMVDARPATEVDMISARYKASEEGNVSTLNRLMQNRLILTDLSLTTKSENPLHISASLGHVDFTTTLLRGKSSLASEFNSLRRLPLHLASAEGHTQIVEELLQVYVDACLVPDQDGRIPLHYAAMRGRADVVRKLITAVATVKETQGNLMVVVSVISTACYQAAVQQPGNTSKEFMFCNTISFVASLSVTFLFLSGLPLRNKFCVWLLSITMLFNLIVLALGYIFSSSAVTPVSLLTSSLMMFMALILLSFLFLTVRFFVRVGKKIYRRFKHKRQILV